MTDALAAQVRLRRAGMTHAAGPRRQQPPAGMVEVGGRFVPRDDALAFRGSVLPVGRTQDGRTVAAWPEMLAAPANALAGLMQADSGAVRDFVGGGRDDLIGNAAELGMAVGVGGAAGTAPDGAIASGMARRPGLSPANLPMDEASRMARAREMGFDVEPRQVLRGDLTAADNEALRRAEADYRAAARARSNIPREGGMTWDAAMQRAREMYRSGEITLQQVEETAFNLMDAAPQNPAAVAAADEALRSAQLRLRDLEAARHHTVIGNFHGSPDISWMADSAAQFDPARTHDLQLAYGRAPAYTTADPVAASGYARAGASWGTAGSKGGAPGVVPLVVRSRKPFDLDARFSPDEARAILGAKLGGLPKDWFYTGKEIYEALVRQQPSYADLRAESQLIGGDIGEMLPKTEANEALKALGYDAIKHVDRYNPGGGGKHVVTIPFEGKNLRSRFAAFDPARSDEADLLAANASALPAAAAAAGRDEMPSGVERFPGGIDHEAEFLRWARENGLMQQRAFPAGGL